MTLPSRGTRRITVAGQVYRWLTSHGHTAKELRVELFAAPGQLLLVQLPYRNLDPSYPSFVYTAAVMPALVRRFIDHALASGWIPAERASGPFLVDTGTAAGFLSPADYHYSRDLVMLPDGRVI